MRETLRGLRFSRRAPGVLRRLGWIPFTINSKVNGGDRKAAQGSFDVGVKNGVQCGCPFFSPNIGRRAPLFEVREAQTEQLLEMQPSVAAGGDVQTACPVTDCTGQELHDNAWEVDADAINVVAEGPELLSLYVLQASTLIDVRQKTTVETTHCVCVREKSGGEEGGC
jgi:hypothetical protein